MSNEVQILRVVQTNEERLRVFAQLGAFNHAEQTGVLLAMIGRVILDGLRKQAGGNPNLMEQAEAHMAATFKMELQMPTQEPK